MAELSPEAFGFKPAGKSTKELDPSAFGFGSPTTEAVTPTAADYLKGIASGVGSLASGVGYLAEVAGADQVGRAIRGIGDTTQRYWQESMTPAGQRAAQSQVFEDDPGAAVPVKLGDRWGQALVMGAAQSAPSMLAAAIPGGLAASVLRGAAGMAASRGIGGALASLAAGTAAPIGGWATNFAGNLAARVPTALGFGAAEGAVAGATNAAQWKSDIEQKPLAELRNMPGFAALESQVGEQAARQQIAEQGASDIMRNTMLATGGIGALTGGGALGSAFQRVTTGAKGWILGAIGRDAAKEAAQEIPQSGGERAIQNIATRDYLDPSQPITQGVLADALSGGAIGSVMGGVMGGGSHLAEGPLQKAAEASTATVPPTSSPNEGQGIPQSIPQSIPQEGGVPPAAGSTAGQTPAAVARADTSVLDVARAAAEDLETADTTSEGFRQTAEGLRKLPQQPNTPVAPGISPVPVSTAAPSLPSNQAESAGVPKPPQQGEKPSGPQAEIAQPAAPGQQAQPAAVFGAAGTVGNTGTQPVPVPANTGTQPVQAPANTGTQPAKAADSAEAEREWRDFVASEGRDIGPRQLAVIREQFMRRQMMNAAIEAATGRVEDARQREVAANRMAILDSLPLTTTGNTIRRFAASLRDAGIRDSRVSPEERQLIARRIAARDTLQHLEQVPPNELTLPEKQVKQAQPTMPRIESLRRRAAMPGVRIVGNRMLDRHGKRLATLSDSEVSELLPKPQQQPARTAEDAELVDFIKSESADLGKRRLTLRALQAIRRQKQAEADKTDLEDLIEAERADLRERFARLLDAQAAARAKKPFVIPPLTTPAQPTTTRVMEQQAAHLPLGKYGKASAPAAVRKATTNQNQQQTAPDAAPAPKPADIQPAIPSDTGGDRKAEQAATAGLFPGASQEFLARIAKHEDRGEPVVIVRGAFVPGAEYTLYGKGYKIHLAKDWKGIQQEVSGSDPVRIAMRHRTEEDVVYASPAAKQQMAAEAQAIADQKAKAKAEHDSREANAKAAAKARERLARAIASSGAKFTKGSFTAKLKDSDDLQDVQGLTHGGLIVHKSFGRLLRGPQQYTISHIGLGVTVLSGFKSQDAAKQAAVRLAMLADMDQLKTQDDIKKDAFRQVVRVGFAIKDSGGDPLAGAEIDFPADAVEDAPQAADTEIKQGTTKADLAQQEADQPSGFDAQFASGNFSLPSQIVGNAYDKAAVASARAQNESRRAEYDAAAQRFLEGPLTAPVPPAKAKAVDRIATDNLSNVRPRPIARKVAPAKAFAAQFRSMLSVAGNKDVRHFINGVHIEDSGRLVATDGNRLAVVDGQDVASAPAKPEEMALATVLGRDGQWIEGKFPDYKRVLPGGHKTQPETVDATAIGDAARGIVRAARYTDLSKVGGGPMPLRIGDLTQTYDAQFLADAADLFRAFGYSSFEASFGDEIAGGVPIYLRSTDGKVQQVIMPRKADPGEQLFAPFVAGQEVVTNAPEVKQDVKKAAAKPATADASTTNTPAAEPLKNPEELPPARSAAAPKDQGSAPASKPDKSNPDDVRFNINDSPFYSQLSRAVENAPNRVFGNADQFRLWLNGNYPQLGIKKDEIFWSGIDDWLALRGKKKTSRDDVLAYLERSGVKVQDVRLGENWRNRKEESERQYRDAIDEIANSPDHDFWYELLVEVAASKDVDINDLSRREKEKLLEDAMPYEDRAFEVEEAFGTDIREEIDARREEEEWRERRDGSKSLDTKHAGGKLVLPGGEDHRELVLTVPGISPWGEDDHTHYGDTGEGRAIGWLRMNTRNDAQGRRVLFIEEVQSKRGQEGRKSGFDVDGSLPAGYAVREHGGKFGIYSDNIRGLSGWSIPPTRTSREAAISYFREMHPDLLVPPAPFLSDSNNRATNAYITLLMKKAIAYAAETGHDAVAWTTGEQQADRYDLSEQVSLVRAIKLEGGRWLIYAGQDRSGYYRLLTAKDGVATSELPGLVGKDLAEKIVAEKGDLATDAPNNDGSARDYTGTDLKIGGEWARAMYGDATGRNSDGRPSLIAQAISEIGKRVGGLDVKPSSIGSLGIQPSIEITEALRARVLGEGFPLFNQSAAQQHASPADRAVYSMAAEGKSAAEILAFLSKASRRPFNRVLATALQKAGLQTTVTADSQAGWNVGNRSYAQKYAAAYSPKADKVALFTPRDAERHVLHELVHAATLKAIEAGGVSAMRMRALFKHVQKSGKLDGQYGMSSLDEFVAEVFSNPRFRDALQDIPAPAGSTLKSAWQWFVRIVARIVGIKTQAAETALDRALRDGLALMKENAAIRAQGAGADRYAIAWHGTPHVWAPEPGFPHGRPRLDKMGTGEGAQAYGWGWYSAEAKAVAEQYAINHAGSKPSIYLSTGEEFKYGSPEMMALFGGFDTVGDAKSRYAELESAFKDGRFAKHLEAIRSLPDSARIIDKALYQLDIPDDVLPHLLDWDKPLSEQSPEVQEALEREFGDALVDDGGTKLHDRFGVWEAKDLTGERLYHDIATRAGTRNDKQASEHLARIGIVGNRYLDGNSRADGEGTYNYVIWDQPTLDRIALLERNGEKLDAIRAADEMRFSLDAGQPFDGPEVAATPLKPGATTLMVDGTERPALNSNGKPIHWSEEGIRNFWRWFSGSSVVDAQGRPLVVYHGTTRGGFTEFKANAASRSEGFVFTGNRSMALTYSGQDNSAEPGARSTKSGLYSTYLALRNQKVIDWGTEYFQKRDGASTNAAIAQAKAEGYDGLIIRNINDPGGYAELMQHRGKVPEGLDVIGDLYIAFHPEQIKSAIGNRGTFDATDPDIRYNVAGTQPAVTPPASPGNLWQAAKAKAAALLTPGRIDKLIYELQDKYVDLRRIRDHIREIGGTITDLNDAYLGEELYHKRLAHRTQDFLKAELRPLLADMKTRGVGMQELESFLHARHAPEANAEMAKRNPNQAEIDAGRRKAAAVVHRLERNLQTAQARGLATKAIEQALNDARGDLVKWNGAQAFSGTEQERRSLSGMTDQAAAAIMAGLSPQRRADLDALATRVDDINAGTLQLLDDYGLMSRTSLDAWRRTYQRYVPLHRDEAHPDSANHPVGQGFSVKGDAAKRRTGSNQKVTHILGHIAMQREAALTRGEKNRVMLKLYLMARQNPLPDVWKVGAVPMLDTIDKATGFVKSVPDPLYRNRPNVVMLRIAGKDVAITMNEHNPQALRMAQALKNLDVDDLHYLIPVVGRATRYFAAINTQYNPIFGVINMMRDLQTGALNLSTTELAGKQRQVMRDALGILGDVVKNKGRMPTGGRWGRLFDEFNEVGGTTGYRDLHLNAEDRGRALLSELQALDRGQVSRAAHAVASWLSDYNEAMENSVRLAAYKAALDSGMSRERAASLAKNLTVNFNRKGRQTRELGALYAFFNAAVQGTTRMAQTLAGPAGRKIMAGGVLAGAVSTVMGIAAMGGGDGEDDEWSKIPEFVKERSLIIPIGRDKYITIPMPLGFHFLPNIGRLAVEMAVYKGKTAGKQMASLFTVLADAFNPLGGSAPIAQIAAPTVLDPVAALLQNKDWTGKPIYIENFNSLDPKPGTQRAKDSATPWAKGFAWAINAITGGTQYVPGGWSPTPDQIDYVIGQLTGGVGREAGKVAATAAAPFTGEELPPYRIPLLGRLYGSTSGTSGQSEAFYEKIRQANAAESEIKGRLKDGGGIADFLKENPRALELAALGNAAERQVRELRGIRRGIVSRGEPDAASRAREVNERMAAVMRGFNRQAERMQ